MRTIRIGMRRYVTQEDMKSKKAQIKARGTTKVEILEGYPKRPKLVVDSVYGTNTLHYTSIVSKQFKWVMQQKECINIKTGKVENLRYLSMNYINKYNNEMGDVDIADHIRNYYRIDVLIRKREWWWSIQFWVVGVILVNAYILFICIHNIHGTSKKYI